jgi:hypothetical protein
MCLEVALYTGCAALLLGVITLRLKLGSISIHTSALKPYFKSPEKPSSICIGDQKRSFIQPETNNNTPYRSVLPMCDTGRLYFVEGAVR